MSFDLSGEPAHTRCLAVALSQGSAGSITFRADIVDLRKAGLMELGGRIATAGIIHKMALHGAFSAETGRLESIDWDQTHVMHEANQTTQGESCRDPMERLAGLVGTPLGKGFDAQLKLCFGGPLGCTHINTLFHELSAVVSRFFTKRDEHPELTHPREPGERIVARSLFFDAFHPEGASTSTLSVRLADIQFGEVGEEGRERLFAHEEVRLLAEVELAGWQLRGVEARERLRRGPVCDPTSWTPEAIRSSTSRGALSAGA